MVEELSHLQDHVPPLTESEVVQVMEEELRVPWEDVFESIEPEPLAAGTIGQVHRARLEGGHRVVIKVQRPDAAESIERDLGLLTLFAEKAEGREALRDLVDIPAVVEHLSSSLRRELDFRQEAGNIERMREVLAAYTRLDVPTVHQQLSTGRLLVMDEIIGGPLRDAPMGEARLEAARQLLEAFYRQVLTEGFFHADPHPGNLLWADDKIHLLDLGMVGSLEEEPRELLLLLLLAFWRQDSDFLADVLLMLGTASGDVDLDALRADLREYVERFHVTSLNDIQLGPMLDALIEIAARHSIRLPASLAMTGKAFSQMQLAVGELDPELDPFSAISDFMVGGIRDRLRGAFEPQRYVYEAQKLKVRANEADRGDRAAGRARGRDPASRSSCAGARRSRTRSGGPGGGSRSRSQGARPCSRPCSPPRPRRSTRGCRSRSGSRPAWPPPRSPWIWPERANARGGAGGAPARSRGASSAPRSGRVRSGGGACARVCSLRRMGLFRRGEPDRVEAS